MADNNKSAVEKLEELNNSFNADYYDKALKKYGKRASLVLPQSYDDSLTFYEAINNFMRTLNGEIERAKSAENLNADQIDNLHAAFAKIEGFQEVENAVIKVELSENANDYIISFTQLNGSTTEAGTIPKNPTDYVTGLTLTNENGVYRFTYVTKDGQSHEIGTVDVPENNPVIELKDSIIENNTKGYDFHTLKETTSDGTENDVMKFYSSQKQITSIKKGTNNSLIIDSVDQTGTEETNNISMAQACVTNVSIEGTTSGNKTNYAIKQTISGVTTPVGTIPTIQNPAMTVSYNNNTGELIYTDASGKTNNVGNIPNNPVMKVSYNADTRNLQYTDASGKTNNVGNIPNNPVMKVSYNADTRNLQYTDASGKTTTAGTIEGFNALMAYPVGSIYLSVNEVDPATIFGGIWEKLPEGKFLYNGEKGGSYTSGNGTGTQTNSHVLTIAEMPSHQHGSNSYANGYPTAVASTGEYDTFVKAKNGPNSEPVNSGNTLMTTTSTGGNSGHAHGIPFIKVFMYRRTA